jgi:hypothetical protein
MDSAPTCMLLARAATTCRQLGCRLTPDSADLAPARLTHVHCTRMLTAVLVLHLSGSSVGCQHTVSGQLHRILHFTAVAATTVAQLLISSHGHRTSDIISCSIH